MVYDAVVVGAGPNGLTAAVVLAEAGCSTLVVEASESIGGGSRTAELTLGGFRHDVCATAHPLGRGSPVFRRLPLAKYGLRWVHPPTALAHPLDDGEVVVLGRSVEETSEGLGADGVRYRRRIEGIDRAWPGIEDRFLGPALGSASDPLGMLKLASFVRPASWEMGRFKGPAARSLLAGCAAHSMMPLGRLFTAGVGWLLLAAGHRYGWPFVAGGSQALVDALASHFTDMGGEIETGRRITDLAQLPPSRVVLADVAPGALTGMFGEEGSARTAGVGRGFRHGPGVFKLDWALSRPVPWRDARMAMAGVLHLGGDHRQIASAERMVWRGHAPDRPFVIAAQPSRFDPSRTPGGGQTLWAYTHVPSGSPVDMREAVEAEIERHAPGFSETVLACHTVAASEWESYNPNYVGGDIGGGVMGVRRLLRGPFRGRSPYGTGVDGIFLCSSSTPPGAGVHGMCGYHAAQAALGRIKSG
ncbi:MAG: NAD(P)/FAD-dependent oxidoreductase [bacterium]|nr:NAD(P)/FAD-dependent oxidoreductase [bacterium]